MNAILVLAAALVVNTTAVPDFGACVAEVRADALAKGVTAKTFDAALA